MRKRRLRASARKTDPQQLPTEPPTQAATSAAIITRSCRGTGSNTGQGADENGPILKMAEREDWALFRSVEGLQQKAGVPEGRLRRLVMKEVADNALDAGARMTWGFVPDSEDLHFIEDNGPGLDGTPEEIASLFSIRRPMRSSKLLRLPQRGALGNGLRVVAGAVLASEGSLAVITRNKRIELCPKADGSTAVVSVTAVERPVGTRIEIGLGPALPREDDPFAWVLAAAEVASENKRYEGKSSPFWYDPVQFHELILAHGSQPLRGLVAQLDGCTGGKAGEIVRAAGLDRMSCESINRRQATTLLQIARQHARRVSPERLGSVGRDAYADHAYAIGCGRAFLGRAKPQAHIPFVAEVWARKTGDKGGIRISMLVNRTPVTSQPTAYRDSDNHICIFGCGVSHGFEDTPTKGAYSIVVNVTTPYCPITSDGKAPSLEPFVDTIGIALTIATKKAQRAAPKRKRLSIKHVMLEHLDAVIAEVSDDGEYRFNPRQLLYKLRPIVRNEIGQELTTPNFNGILTDYEREHGEIPGMYREPRGSIYHPHRNETITLGTLMVEDYERPVWLYNKVVYIEKEGFSEALKDARWAERHDCMLMSSKGFSTRAARDLVDKLAEHDEPVTIFCVHDADAYGTMIYQTLQEATKARGERKVQIVNLGLEPWEAVENRLDVEDVELNEHDKRRPVADYVRARDDEDWEGWLQNHRVELNVMTTPKFIEWLDGKMADYNRKLVPPADVLEKELAERIERKVRATVTERILREAGFENQVAEAVAAIEKPNGEALAQGIEDLFDREPDREWRDYIEAEAKMRT
jgi:hypothetical protein